MDINLNCNQVESLINFYIEGKLAFSLKNAVEMHLQKCTKCRKKIEQLQNVLMQYNQNNEDSSDLNASYDSELVKSLSAYVDNELDTFENVRIKKMTISNPAARKKLESIYKYKKLLHSVYEKTKNNIKFDYSKNIVATINDTNDYTTNYFRNIAILLFLICMAIACGFVYLYF